MNAEVTINGFTLAEGAYLKDQKCSTLNQMLGVDGLPKYNASQMKSTTKAKLLAEVQPIYDAAIAVEPVIEKVYKKRGAPRKPTKNKASAQVKKCLLIKAIINGEVSLDEAQSIVTADYWLSVVCKLDDLQKAYDTKQRPYSNRGSKRVVDNTGYIVAKGTGE